MTIMGGRSISPDAHAAVPPLPKNISLEVKDAEHIRKTLLEDEQLEVRSERRLKKPPAIIAHALSGVLGSVAAELILFPVDTVKLAVQTSSVNDTSCFLSTLRKILQTHGVAGLYKGISTSVVKESIHSFTYWVWHGLIFRYFTAGRADTSATPTGMRLLLNLVAKQLNWLCSVPFEVVATANQLAADSPGLLVTAARLRRDGGLGTFYRGLPVSMALAINPAIMNTLITSFLRLAALFRMTASGHGHEEAREHGPMVIGMATGMAKFLATCGTYPLIRAKVLQQTSRADERLSVLAIWRFILKTEGMLGLYRGLLAMSYKTVCWNMIMMSFKHLLGPKRAVTPPATPPRLDPATLIPPMPWMGRMPFPAELITNEKLDEILSCLKGDQAQPRVQKLEIQMSQVSEELQEVKKLLREFLLHRREVPRLAGA